MSAMPDGRNQREASTNHYITVITANAAGGARKSQGSVRALALSLAEHEPDFIFLQELVQCQHFDGRSEDDLEDLRTAGLDKYQPVFRPSLNSQDHPCPPIVPGTEAKPGTWFGPRFERCKYAAQGIGYLIHPRWTCGDANDVRSERISSGRVFLGDRETEPRYVVTVEARRSDIGCHVLLACVHLTTLRDEEKDPEKARVASAVRQHQVKAICRLFEEDTSSAPIILAGDFNSLPGSSELELLTAEGFHRVTKLCTDYHQLTGTHRRTGRFIDHIWVRPIETLAAQDCGLVDTDAEGPSDHRPVLARIGWQARVS